MNKLLNMEWGKVFKGGLIAGAGCVLTYLSQWISGADFGSLTPIITAGLAVAVNFFRKFGFAKHEEQPE